MDSTNRILSAFSKDTTQSEESLHRLLDSASPEDLEPLMNDVFTIPFPNLQNALISHQHLPSFPSQPLPAISHFLEDTYTRELLPESSFKSPSEYQTYQKVTQEIFLLIGRVPNYERIMSLFPPYLEKHHEVIKNLFNDDLSISAVWRYYIAYMAAATHKCEYLMRLEERLCRLSHQEWLEEHFDTPEKLRSLGAANVKLAHRPWEFTEADVRRLLPLWNPNELLLALIILCQFHCLAGFALGVGVAPEPDLPLLHSKEAQLASKASPTPVDPHSEDTFSGEEDFVFSKAAGDYLAYIDYPMDSISRSFNASDFRFADQASYILEKMVPEVSESVRDKISTTFAMTYEGLDSEDTGPLRRAIWNYVQRVYGLQYDDYNYTEINKFIQIGTKKYIKKVACFPEAITMQDYLEINLSPFDFIHLNLIICEARLEAQLVYMLHAFQRAMDIG